MTNQIRPDNDKLQVPFNPAPAAVMHLDINSCFATIEQQANPKLRGKPIAVAAYPSPSGCILAPSVEAKRFGVKTGMRVKEGKLLCPKLIVLGCDPWKYRNIHLKLRQLLFQYSDQVTPKSIDEFVIYLLHTPAFRKGMIQTAREIKQRIKQEIGEWITVSVGIAPNRFLAKLGASIHKPDGLDEINQDTYLDIYSKLELMDLCGIKVKNSVRLNYMGIYTVKQFYEASLWKLRGAFESVLAYYWYFRLRGWEIDDANFARRSYGNSYALPQPFDEPNQLAPILQKLVEKMGGRLRKAGYKARGIHLGIQFRDGYYWHHGMTVPEVLFDSRDIYDYAFKLLLSCPHEYSSDPKIFRAGVGNLAVSCFNLVTGSHSQLELFQDTLKKERLVKAVDEINEVWGSFVLRPARMIETDNVVHDRIAFGGVKELEEFTIGNQFFK